MRLAGRRYVNRLGNVVSAIGSSSPFGVALAPRQAGFSLWSGAFSLPGARLERNGEKPSFRARGHAEGSNRAIAIVIAMPTATSASSVYSNGPRRLPQSSVPGRLARRRSAVTGLFPFGSGLK